MDTDRELGRIIIITGLSGSGKSTALDALEDADYFCIDNLPILLLPRFLALRARTSEDAVKLGVVMDMRELDFVRHFKEVFSDIKAKYDLSVIFLEASDQVLVKRYSETRRRHPLSGADNLLAGIRREREMMEPVRKEADKIIDTTAYSPHRLRELFTGLARSGSGRSMAIELLSFGFKYGAPPEADMVMDVRFLRNPYFEEDLRALDGRDDRVVEYVMAGEEGPRLVEELAKLLEFVIPLYRREGKSYLTIAIGCTGGWHRSVAVVGRLAERLKATSDTVLVRHRELPAEPSES